MPTGIGAKIKIKKRGKKKKKKRGSSLVNISYSSLYCTWSKKSVGLMYGFDERVGGVGSRDLGNLSCLVIINSGVYISSSLRRGYLGLSKGTKQVCFYVSS